MRSPGPVSLRNSLPSAYVWMSNVTWMKSSHVWKSRVTYVKEISVRRPWESISLRRVYKWLMSYTWISHVAYEWVMSHVWMCHVTCMPWLIHICTMTHADMCRDLCIHVPWLMHTRAMTHAYWWHSCDAWLIQIWGRNSFSSNQHLCCVMSHSYK